MAKPFPISATIITFNEEDNIEQCITSLQAVADEVIVIDSNSNDRTVSIAKSLGAQVFSQSFLGHIEQKNFALTKTTHNMVLSLDADEALSPTLINSIKNLQQKSSSYSMNRKNFFCGTWIKYGGWYPDRKIRLWDKTQGQWGGKNPHDKVIMNTAEPSSFLDGDILHYSYKHKDELPKQLDYFASIGADAYFKAGKKSNKLLILANPIFTFFKTYILKLGFLDGKYGYYIAKHQAMANRKKYQELLKLQSRTY